MINAVIAVYRAIRVRPHCDRRNGIHSWACALAGPVTKSRCDFDFPIDD
jgi:hypothetical protein